MPSIRPGAQHCETFRDASGFVLPGAAARGELFVC
jgi:hypothetical protein